MRTIFLAVAVTAAVTVPAGPAVATPPPLAELRELLLTEAGAPAGYRVGDTQDVQLPVPRGRSLCADDPGPEDEPETTVVMRSFTEADDTGVAMGVAAPGSFNARAFVAAAQATLTRCPEEKDDTFTRTLTALTLPVLGDAAAGFREVKVATDGTRTEAAVAAVADGDLLAVFEMAGGDETDQADFLAFVSAGAQRLAGAG
ncbi:hypothetical protein [Actinoplanes subglobosus]|uniref:Sensor domain-containing protein n=1 Tax=Actinoplanes subglobosus TaxID=1547892 RepID=A0ABV8IZ25_9ACTN